MKKITVILTNKYLISTVFFVVWMLFFDQRDYFQLKERQVELQKLEAKKQSDPKFANDASAQLNFIYKNSLYYESAHLRYPVYRLLKDN